MSLSCTVSETLPDIGRKLPILTYSTYIWRPFWDRPIGITPCSLGRQKTSITECGIISWSGLRFSHFGTIPAYDRQTDGRTDRETDRHML